METTKIKATDIKKQWVVVDAEGKVLGRLATEIARVLRGKHKTTFVPHLDSGDYVVVVNADKIKLSGPKMQDKLYYRHSQYIGGIKAIRAGDMLKAHPERLIELAVKGMLPHNKLGRQVISNLKVYAGKDHPHAPQKPVPMAPRVAEK